MELLLPELGNDFNISPLNDGNTYKTIAGNQSFIIQPGSYLISKKNSQYQPTSSNHLFGSIKMNEYVALKPLFNELYIAHDALLEVSAGKEFVIIATELVLIHLIKFRWSCAIRQINGRHYNCSKLRRMIIK